MLLVLDHSDHLSSSFLTKECSKSFIIKDFWLLIWLLAFYGYIVLFLVFSLSIPNLCVGNSITATVAGSFVSAIGKKV